MKIIDIMMDGESMPECKPYFDDFEGRITVAICESGVCGLRIYGEDAEMDRSGEYSREDLHRAARIVVGAEFGDYGSSEDVEILRENLRCGGCTECPWRSICDLVQADIEIPDTAPRYPDDDDVPDSLYSVTVDCCNEVITIRATSAHAAIEAVAAALGRDGLHYNYIVDAETRGTQYCEGWIGYTGQHTCHAIARRCAD